MQANNIRWANPLLNEDASTLFGAIYGENAQVILCVLEHSPYEIALISILLTFYNKLKRGI